MSFKEFDLSDYINALENFKNTSADDVIKHWGSVENFDMFIQKIKDDETEAAKLAMKQFGSIEQYTEAMKHNLEHFSELVDNWQSQIPEEMRADDKQYCSMIIELYSNDYLKSVIDTKYGTGSCDYIVEAFRSYPCKSAPATL